MSSAKNDPHLPCFVVPYGENPRFHGRKEILAQITDALDPQSGNVNAPDTAGLRSFVLSGPGGIGKTQLATQFVHEHRLSFDAVFWVYADDTRKLGRSFARIAVELGLVAEESAEAQDRVLTRDLVLGWLAQPYKSYKHWETGPVEEASWLVVFDNADDPALLDDYWPRSSSGSILMTSRVPLPQLQFYSTGPGCVLPPFSLDEAADYMLRITQREDDDEDRDSVNAVAQILGCMPLAIAQMAGSIVRRDITFAEFLQEYQDPWAQAELFSQTAGNRKAEGYEHNVSTVWGVKDLKHSAYLLDVLAFLDPDGIPEYILEANDATTDMKGFPRSKKEYGQARDELLQSSLVSRNRTEKKLVIHRLIQDTVRLSVMRADYTDTMPLIEMAKTLCDPLLADNEGMSELHTDVREEFEEQLRMFHFHRGALAHHINQPETALSEFTEFNRLLREKLGSAQDQRLGVALNELGVAYLQTGDAAKAEEHLKNSVDVLQHLEHVSQDTIAMPLINLGFALWVQGRQGEAASVFESTLANLEATYRSNDIKSFAYDSRFR
ncbi:hypothetical protein LTR85_002104 [Meristemomyces frigidus]|nr:hypothetical protein LTR85_002104 [Meristemomyces frigidus]